MERRMFLNQFTVMPTSTSKIVLNSSQIPFWCIKDHLQGSEAKSYIFKLLPWISPQHWGWGSQKGAVPRWCTVLISSHHASYSSDISLTPSNNARNVRQGCNWALGICSARAWGSHATSKQQACTGYPALLTRSGSSPPHCPHCTSLPAIIHILAPKGAIVSSHETEAKAEIYSSV